MGEYYIDVNMKPEFLSRRGGSAPVTRPLREAATAAAAAPEALLRGARAVSRSLTALTTDEHARLLLLAAFIGLAAALAVTAFYRVIDLVQRLTLGWAEAIPLADALVIPLLVALGLAASQAIVRYGAQDSEGENVPDVMYRANLRGGVVPVRPVLAKTCAAAVLIGTGGNVGAEGPVIVGGAAAAAGIGGWLHASPHRLRTLVGCGAAAGLSAAFNAPIAGVLFGLEKILGAAGGGAFGPFVVASIVAAAASRAVFGNHPVLAVPLPYGLHSAWELPLYAALGLVAGAAAVAYGRFTWGAHDWFGARSRATGIAIGALVVGGLDLVFRNELWGHGHQAVDLGALGLRPAGFLLGLFAAKLLATGVTLAVGRAGGVFTPALFLGATLGTAFGHLADRLLPPGSPIVAGAFGLAGMAGVVAGATHAPLTAILMAFEMTGDYALILPIMLTSTVAFVVARRLHPESIYTEWLVRRGIVLTRGADAAVLARSTVAECLRPALHRLAPDASHAEALRLVRESPQSFYPVVASDGRLEGQVALGDVGPAPPEGPGPTARDLMRPVAGRVLPEDTLLTALRRMAALDVDLLPVVDREENRYLMGLVTRGDLFRAYERALRLELGHDPEPERTPA